MSNVTHVTVDGSYREVKKMYAVLDSVMHKIKKGYVIEKNFEPCIGIPESYTQLEYVESDGSQYIDTGLNPSATDTRVVFQFKKTGTLACMVGSSAGASQDALTITEADGIWVAGSGPHCSQSYSDGVTYLMDVHAMNGALTVVTNGTEQTDTYTGDMPTTASFYLFAQNQNGNAIQKSAMRLMSAKFYTDGVLQRDYVPCKNSDGTVGLYDLANGDFVSSDASMPLIAGETLAYVTKLVFETPAVKSYSGAYTVSQVTDAEGRTCNLYTLTGSGTLVLEDTVQYWMCGGGALGSYAGGSGGSGGYIDTGNLAAGEYVVSIGAGGGSDDGGDTTITKAGDSVATAAGGERLGNGGSGRGEGGKPSSYAGTGSGVTTYPFGITSLYAHSAGGAGGNYMKGTTNVYYKGGTGGTNGGSGGSRSKSTRDDAKNSVGGGARGGGAGGTVNVNPGVTIDVTCVNNGGSASFYGSGGGGGAGIYYGEGYSPSEINAFGGSGYQGVVYLLIP